jgi:hypothetical protein
MKKYLFGILTIIIAVSLSAFIMGKKSMNTATESKSKSQTGYYWYDLDIDGKIVGSTLNPSATDTKANVIEGGTNEQTSCSDQAMPYCLAGCTSSTLGTGDSPDAATGNLDNRIKHDF